MANNNQPVFTGKVTLIMIAIGSAGFVVTMYRLISIWINQHHEAMAAAQTSSIKERISLSHLIPAHKYQKKKKKKKKKNEDDDDVADGDEDGTCAVCLGDFEEGEGLRTLPMCMHSFHVPCIDMWLHSHSSCPVCRADATPSPAVLHRSQEIGSGELNNAHHSINMMQIALV